MDNQGLICDHCISDSLWQVGWLHFILKSINNTQPWIFSFFFPNYCSVSCFRSQCQQMRLHDIGEPHGLNSRRKGFPQAPQAKLPSPSSAFNNWCLTTRKENFEARRIFKVPLNLIFMYIVPRRLTGSRLHGWLRDWDNNTVSWAQRVPLGNMNSLSKGPSSASTLVRMKLSSHQMWAPTGRRRSWRRRWHQGAAWPPRWCRLGPPRWGQHRKSVSQPQEMLFGAGQAWGLLAYLPGVVRRYPLTSLHPAAGISWDSGITAEAQQGFLLASEWRFLSSWNLPHPHPQLLLWD